MTTQLSLTTHTKDEVSAARAALRLAIASHREGDPEEPILDAQAALKAAVSGHRRALGRLIDDLRDQVRASTSYRIADQLCREIRRLARQRQTVSTYVRQSA